jgi:hypothetical protein
MRGGGIESTDSVQEQQGWSALQSALCPSVDWTAAGGSLPGRAFTPGERGTHTAGCIVRLLRFGGEEEEALASVRVSVRVRDDVKARFGCAVLVPPSRDVWCLFT